MGTRRTEWAKSRNIDIQLNERAKLKAKWERNKEILLYTDCKCKSDEIKLDGNKKSRMGQVKNHRNITERREQSYESKWERSKEILSYTECKCKLDEIKLDETIA